MMQPWSRMFVLITRYVHIQLHLPTPMKNDIHQPNSTGVVITTPSALGRWSHKQDYQTERKSGIQTGYADAEDSN